MILINILTVQHNMTIWTSVLYQRTVDQTTVTKLHRHYKICTTILQLRSCGVQDLESECSHLSALVPEELASVLYDLFVRQQTVGLLLTQGEDLPQCDTKCPHVASCGELTLVEKTEPLKILICNLQLKIS